LTQKESKLKTAEKGDVKAAKKAKKEAKKALDAADSDDSDDEVEKKLIKKATKSKK
jgi:hypothetical protein